MVLLDELKSRLTAYEEPLKDLRDSLDLASKKLRMKNCRKGWRNPDSGMIGDFPARDERTERSRGFCQRDRTALLGLRGYAAAHRDERGRAG